MITQGHILFASDNTEQSIAEARAYIASHKMKQEDVRLIKTEDQIQVVAKRYPESWRE